MKALRNIVVSAVLLVCIATTPEPSEASQSLTCSRAEQAIYGHDRYLVSNGVILMGCQHLSRTRVVYKASQYGLIEARSYRSHVIVLPYR